MSETFSYVNGEIFSSDVATVSVFDHGFTVADGVFETLKIQSGVPFALNRHLNRLGASCRGLGIRFPEMETLENAIDQVCELNKHVKLGRMRITVTSGNGPLGSDRLAGKPTVVISVAEQSLWPATSEVLLVPWIRNEKSPLVSIKTTSYAENVYALSAAKDHGFGEAIFLNSEGLLTEGTGSNIFIVKDKEVLTPSSGCGLLQGVTRDLVIEWAADFYPISQRKISQDELYAADEIFITSTTRDVSPVSRLASLDKSSRIENDKAFQVGPVTQEIARIFSAKSNQMSNP